MRDKYKHNQLISKPHKTVMISMVIALSMAGTMSAEAEVKEVGLVNACTQSGNAIVCAKAGPTAAIPEPTTLALISAGLIGLFGVRRQK